MSTHEYPKEMIDPGADAPVVPAEPPADQLAFFYRLADDPTMYRDRMGGLADWLRAELAAASAGDKPATSEPVAWQWRHSDGGGDWAPCLPSLAKLILNGSLPGCEVRHLYTAPPDVQRDAERWQWWLEHGHTTDDEQRSLENELLPAGESFADIAAAVDAAMAAKEPT